MVDFCDIFQLIHVLQFIVVEPEFADGCDISESLYVLQLILAEPECVDSCDTFAMKVSTVFIPFYLSII